MYPDEFNYCPLWTIQKSAYRHAFSLRDFILKSITGLKINSFLPVCLNSMQQNVAFSPKSFFCMEPLFVEGIRQRNGRAKKNSRQVWFQVTRESSLVASQLASHAANTNCKWQAAVLWSWAALLICAIQMSPGRWWQFTLDCHCSLAD